MFTPRRVSSWIAGQSRGRARHLDHHVRLAEPPPQGGCLGDGRLGVVGRIRGALERDEPVAAPAVLICRAQQAGGRADVVEREREEQLLRVTLPARGQRAQLAVVAVRIRDRLGEDRGIGRRAGDAILADQLGKLAGLEHLAGQRVQPDGHACLPQPPQVGIGCHGHSSAQLSAASSPASPPSGAAGSGQRSHLDGPAQAGQRLDVLVSP